MSYPSIYLEDFITSGWERVAGAANRSTFRNR